MAITLTSDPNNRSWWEDAPSGTVIQMASGQNTTAARQTWGNRNNYRPVPGRLQATLTPQHEDNIIVARVKMMWGGFYGTSNDMGIGFKVFREDSNGDLDYDWTNRAQYARYASTEEQIDSGWYEYNWGNSDSSTHNDHILVYGTAGTTNTSIYELYWAATYEGGRARWTHWNLPVNRPYTYTPIHVNTIQVMEIKA